MAEIILKEVSEDLFYSMESWLKEHFGPGALWPSQLQNSRNSFMWASLMPFEHRKGEPFSKIKFLFREEKDLTIFLLRFDIKN